MVLTLLLSVSLTLPPRQAAPPQAPVVGTCLSCHGDRGMSVTLPSGETRPLFVDVETFRMVVRTFQSVFPHVGLWADPEFPDVIFLGSDRPLSIDPLALNALFRNDARVAESLGRIGYPEAGALFRAFLLDEAEVRRFAAEQGICAVRGPT